MHKTLKTLLKPLGLDLNMVSNYGILQKFKILIQWNCSKMLPLGKGK